MTRSKPEGEKIVTEAIDQLFLELSQVTKAKTATEIILGYAVERAFKVGLRIGNSPDFSRQDAQKEWEKFRDYHLREVAEHLKELPKIDV
ncbi:hypothetical protein [Candidatus Sororendozoicomonas aggregata]|uniref:hypothetical protein n=1 Tax=Candidatus Sororendozoicomonas aggregata TaxID=3073239 RepID=UPI002ED179BB